jgi:hypothetical protein
MTRLSRILALITIAVLASHVIVIFVLQSRVGAGDEVDRLNAATFLLAYVDISTHLNFGLTCLIGGFALALCVWQGKRYWGITLALAIALAICTEPVLIYAPLFIPDTPGPLNALRDILDVVQTARIYLLIVLVGTQLPVPLLALAFSLRHQEQKPTDDARVVSRLTPPQS